MATLLTISGETGLLVPFGDTVAFAAATIVPRDEALYRQVCRQ